MSVTRCCLENLLYKFAHKQNFMTTRKTCIQVYKNQILSDKFTVNIICIFTPFFYRYPYFNLLFFFSFIKFYCYDDPLTVCFNLDDIFIYSKFCWQKYDDDLMGWCLVYFFIILPCLYVDPCLLLYFLVEVKSDLCERFFKLMVV